MTAPAERLPATNERLVLLDSLRGFALLGIMFVNITWFTGFAVLSAEQRAALGTDAIDTVVAWLVHVGIDSKFWSFFALLFGVGFALQMQRAERDGRDIVPVYRRRMVVLLGIGLLHAVFVWFGDILSIYAVAGLALLLFRKMPPRRVLGWAVVLLLSPIVVNGVWLIVDASLRTPDMPRIDPGHGPGHLLVNFSTGTYADAFAANWAFLTERWLIAVYTARFFTVLGMFLLGVYAGRMGIVEFPQRHRALLRKILIGGLLIGVPANIALASVHVPLRPPSVGGWGMFIVSSIGLPALCVAYAGGITLIFQWTVARRVLAPFAAVGRMSLTNYVTQSVVGLALFYGCGLGLWGSFGITIAVGYLFAFFAVQAMLSAWWLHHFNYGPLEWVWRCLTYGRWLPLRRSIASSGSEVSTPESVR